MLKSVMIPTDFSADCALILRAAEGLPALGVRRVVLAHVIEASGLEGPVIAASVDKVREQIRSLTPRLTDAGLDVEVRVSTGEPAVQLGALANETHVGAVICGTHAKSFLSRLIAGSLSDQILVEAHIPTLLVRYGLLARRDVPADTIRSFGKQVILPTDFSAASDRALTAALGLPAGAIGVLYLLHAVDPSLSAEKRRRAAEGAEFQLANMVDRAAERGITARAVIREGDPSRVVLREIDERRATGIIIGSRGQNPLQEALLGTTSTTLIRQASCPVMIVP